MVKAESALVLEWIHPGNIKGVWDLIRPGLEVISKSSQAWLPEDIYMSIKTGSCHLHIGYKDGEYKGFIVTQHQDNHGEVTLHVWAGYSNGRDFNLLEQSTDTIKEWAANIKAQKITFSTNRKGWARQALKLGFKQSLITYEMKV